MTNFKNCRRCGQCEWTDLIESVRYESARGLPPRLVEAKTELRLCKACGKQIEVAIAFQKGLPRGFGWTLAVVRYKNGREEECRRLIVTD